MPELYGNTTGLSANAIRSLERIYRRRVPSDKIATPELVRSLADASRETKRQVGALVHRSGEVDYVVVGHASGLMLPDIGRLRAAEGRFRALRLVHTHLFNEPLTRDELACRIRAHFKLTEKSAPISVIARADTPAESALRPANLTLDLQPLAGLLKTQPESFEAQLDQFVIPPPCREWYHAQ